MANENVKVASPTSGAVAPTNGAGSSSTAPISNTAPIIPAQYIGSKNPTPLLQLDKIGQDSHVMSVVCKDVLFNGNVVSVGDLVTTGMFNDGEIFEATQVSSSSDLIALIGYDDVCPLEYIPNDQRYVEAGKPTRAYILHRGDIITLTNLGIAGGTPVKGSYLVAEGYNLTVTSSKPASGLVLRCVGTDNINGYSASVLMVVQAQ